MVREITNKEIFSVLDEAYAKSSVDKPRTILFVHENDDSVRELMRKWVNMHSNYWGPGGYLDGDPNEEFVFCGDIRNKEVICLSDGYTTSANLGSKKRLDKQNLVFNTINKKGTFIDKALRLLIVHENTQILDPYAIFFEEDYDKFDDVILVKVDLDFFKEECIKEYNGLILRNMKQYAYRCNYLNGDAEKYLDYAKELSIEKEICLFILQHKNFHFIEAHYDDNGKIHLFSPVGFNNQVKHLIWLKNQGDLFKFKDYLLYQIDPEVSEILIPILVEYDSKKELESKTNFNETIDDTIRDYIDDLMENSEIF